MQTPQAGTQLEQVTSPKFESPNGLMCTFWDGGRKLEYLEETHAERPELELNAEPSGLISWLKHLVHNVWSFTCPKNKAEAQSSADKGSS